MNTSTQFSQPLAALLVAVCFFSTPVWAGAGHDHGDGPTAVGGQALPRFAAVSEAFELVGVLSGKEITLYLDRFADNSPVRGAQIELDIGGAKYQAEPLGEDAYAVVLPEALQPGVLPVTAMLTAGNETDLLAGEFDLHEETPTDEAEHTHGWTEFAGWGAAGLALFALLAWGARRAFSARNTRIGGAA